MEKKVYVYKSKSCGLDENRRPEDEGQGRRGAWRKASGWTWREIGWSGTRATTGGGRKIIEWRCWTQVEGRGRWLRWRVCKVMQWTSGRNGERVQQIGKEWHGWWKRKWVSRDGNWRKANKGGPVSTRVTHRPEGRGRHRLLWSVSFSSRTSVVLVALYKNNSHGKTAGVPGSIHTNASRDPPGRACERSVRGARKARRWRTAGSRAGRPWCTAARRSSSQCQRVPRCRDCRCRWCDRTSGVSPLVGALQNNRVSVVGTWNNKYIL